MEELRSVKNSVNQVLQHVWHQIVSLGTDVFDLFYPRICPGCSSSLMEAEKELCLHCIYGLPLTYFWRYPVTPIERLFHGRMQVDGASAYLHFTEKGMVQRLLHQLKYKGQPEIGHRLGALFGHKLREHERYTDTEVIIPVPLHPSKQRRRGYNQSYHIAKGMAEAFGCRVDTKSVVRTMATETQTKKGKYDRTENVASVFQCIHPLAVQGKRVMLVDDVVTTGATLEAVGKALLEAGVSKLYVVALAVPD